MADMTLQQVSHLLTKKGVMPSRELRQKMADAIDAHLTGVGEPVAFTTPSMNVVFRPGRYPGNGVDLFTAPPASVDVASLQSRLAAADALLRAESALLRAWARESREGGWSTHQVDPMKRRADEIDAHLSENTHG